MAVPEGGCTKEATILGLANDIYGALEDLQSRLDNRFNRSVKGEETCEGRPMMPNVLDEIIEKLESDLGWLRRITSFISSDVLPKIN